MSQDAQFLPLHAVFDVAIRRRHPTLDELVRADGRYPLEAFHLVFEALEYTAKLFGKNPRSELAEEKHVTGRQLCEGIRQFALDQYGPLAKVVLNELNIHSTEDFGRIVFFLVEHGLMGKTDEDTLEDFKDQYDFEEAFGKGFEFRCDDADLSVTGPH